MGRNQTGLDRVQQRTRRLKLGADGSRHKEAELSSDVHGQEHTQSQRRTDAMYAAYGAPNLPSSARSSGST